MQIALELDTDVCIGAIVVSSTCIRRSLLDDRIINVLHQHDTKHQQSNRALLHFVNIITTKATLTFRSGGTLSPQDRGSAIAIAATYVQQQTLQWRDAIRSRNKAK